VGEAKDAEENHVERTGAHRAEAGELVLIVEDKSAVWASCRRFGVTSASIAKGLGIISMPGSRKPFAIEAFSA